MLGDLMDKLLVIVFSYAWFGVEAYNQIQQRKRRDRTEAPADRGSLVLLYVCIAIGYSVAIAVSFAPLGRLPGEQPLWLVAGAVLIACGLWIRHVAMRTLARFFTYQVEIRADHQLVETGPYRRIRHPGYLGQLLVFAGVGVALANWMSIAAMIVFTFAGFRWRIGVEEAALQARFADQFETYRRRTWRLIPWLY